MTPYDISRRYWDWAYDHPTKATPAMAALMFFIIEHWNRLGQKAEFGLPSMMAMEALGIRNWRTYKAAFTALEGVFFTVVERSVNQYSANIITLNTKSAYVKNTKAYTNAVLKHTQKQSNSTDNGTDNGNHKSTYKGIAGIDKPNNLRPNNLRKEEEDSLFDFLETDHQAIALKKNEEAPGPGELSEPGSSWQDLSEPEAGTLADTLYRTGRSITDLPPEAHIRHYIEQDRGLQWSESYRRAAKGITGRIRYYLSKKGPLAPTHHSQIPDEQVVTFFRQIVSSDVWLLRNHFSLETINNKFDRITAEMESRSPRAPAADRYANTETAI